MKLTFLTGSRVERLLTASFYNCKRIKLKFKNTITKSLVVTEIKRNNDGISDKSTFTLEELNEFNELRGETYA